MNQSRIKITASSERGLIGLLESRHYEIYDYYNQNYDYFNRENGFYKDINYFNQEIKLC